METALNKTLQDLDNRDITRKHHWIDWATQYARKFYKGGNEEIHSRTDYKKLPKGTRKDIESEMEGSDFVEQKMNRIKKLSVEQHIFEKDGKYELSSEAKVAFKPMIEKVISENDGSDDDFPEFDINGSFDEDVKKEIIDLFQKDEDEYIEDVGLCRVSFIIYFLRKNLLKKL